NVTLGTGTVGERVPGQASITLDPGSLTVGKHMITATFAPGSGNVSPSNSTNPNTTVAATINDFMNSNDVFAANTAVPLSGTFSATAPLNPTAVWTVTNPATNPATNIASFPAIISGTNISGS